MDDTLAFLDFNPQLHPLGYALAVELLGEGACGTLTADQLTTPPQRTIDRFGWEFDSEAA